MTPRDLIAAAIGTVIGVGVTYFVMERIHDNEITELLRSISDERETEVLGVVECETVLVEEPRNKRATEINEAIDILDDVASMYGMSKVDEIDMVFEEEDEEDSDSEEDEEMQVTDGYSGVYIINNDEVTDRQVVFNYDHLNRSLELVKMLSVEAEKFDDIIENDAMFAMLNEEAYELLMNSEPSTETRIVCVRNNVLNLDFVVSY